MKEFKLKDGELLASFKPDGHARPQTQPGGSEQFSAASPQYVSTAHGYNYVQSGNAVNLQQGYPNPIPIYLAQQQNQNRPLGQASQRQDPKIEFQRGGGTQVMFNYAQAGERQRSASYFSPPTNYSQPQIVNPPVLIPSFYETQLIGQPRQIVQANQVGHGQQPYQQPIAGQQGQILQNQQHIQQAVAHPQHQHHQHHQQQNQLYHQVSLQVNPQNVQNVRPAQPQVNYGPPQPVYHIPQNQGYVIADQETQLIHQNRPDLNMQHQYVPMNPPSSRPKVASMHETQTYPPQHYQPQQEIPQPHYAYEQHYHHDQHIPHGYHPAPSQEYPPEYYQHPQQVAYDSNLWQQRFFYLYDKYEIFYEKYDEITKETAFLAEQFLHVDNEEEWLALKEKYDLLVERMNEMREEYMLILQEMQENIQHNQKIDNGNSIKEEAGRVWEHRYHELLEQYESLSHHYAELQSSSMAQNDLDENERLAMMNQKYARLEAQYNHVIEQLQSSPNSMPSRQQHEDLLKYTQQLQGYIEQLESQNNTLMKGAKNSVEGSKMLDQSELNLKIIEKDTEIKNLTHMIVSLEQKMKQSEQRPKSNIKDPHVSQLQNQIHEMTIFCSQLQQKLSMKQYEINGLKDKVQYLEEQLHSKNEEVHQNSKYLQEKLERISAEIQSKSATTHQDFRFDQDYENRIKEYQKIIASKNNEIRVLEERIFESESETRKANTEKGNIIREWQDKVNNVQADFRKKLHEKENKLREMEQEMHQVDIENKRKAQEKDNAVKNWQAEITMIKEDIENRLLEKDIIIKNLKDASSRLENEIKDRNVELSRVRSPNMRSPNQSYVVENGRFEQEIRLLNEQLERKSDELGKLKKERDTKNKQYRDLEHEYDTIQQENNKRRIQINNLKRQISTVQNYTYEIENLKVIIGKKNVEISELKNSVFDKEKLGMQIDVKKREIEKLNEISRFKSKEIEQLTERNYELQEKLRQKDFKITNVKVPQYPPQNNRKYEEVLSLQQELRKKDIEASKYKIEYEQIARALKRQTEELQNIKQKYPARVKQAEDESNDLRMRLASFEKKFAMADAKCKELEEINKKIRASTAEELANENLKLKEYYVKFIDRQEEQNKQIKEKARKYEIELHDYQQEIDGLKNKAKDAEIVKNELTRKIKSLNDKLEEKEEEIRTVRTKQNGQISGLRRKQARLIEMEAQLKSKQYHIRELEKKNQAVKVSLKQIKKEYEDYKHSIIERMEVSTHKEMENLNKQIADYESRMVFQTHNFDFKVKDKKANQIFQRHVIYELKEENDMLRRELQGKGVNISLQKIKINHMQQEALMKSKHLLNKEEHSYTEEINFYREKNKELEERVNNQITVNKKLREKMEEIMENTDKEDELQKARLKITELEAKHKEYEHKISQLQQETKSLKKECNSLNVNSQNNEDYKTKLQQSYRNISQLTLQRNSLKQELTVLQVERDNLDHRCKDLDLELNKLTNQNTVLKSEIERLKETNFSKNNSESDDLRRQINDLTRDLQDKNSYIDRESQQLEHVIGQYESLQNYVSEIEAELRKVKSLTSSNKSEQADFWRTKAEEFEHSLTQMRGHFEQLNQQCEYYKSQSGGVKEETFYYIELIRNNCIELESLASEIGLESERLVTLVDRITQNSHRGLECCQYLQELLAA